MLSYEWTPPRPNDIVAVAYPRRRGRMVVKRVIAAEGDTVQIAAGRVFVNGRSYFVLGDHRNRSTDSRHWGVVAKRDIRGRISVRWWPWRSMRTF